MFISEFQQLIKELYYKNDKERGLNGTFLWFIEEIGEFSEALRHFIFEKNIKSKKELKYKIGEEFADIIAWVSSLANLLDVDLEKVLFEKYPNYCKKCKTKPCICAKR